MAALSASGRVTTLDHALELLGQPDPPEGVGAERDPVVITFDDGTRDLAEVAAPILSRYRLPALLYVATDFVDSGHPFPEDGRRCRGGSWAIWCRPAGSCGSHTHTHALLDRLAPPGWTTTRPVDRTDLVAHRTRRRPLRLPQGAGGHPRPSGRCVDASARRRWPAPDPNRYGDTDPWLLARSPVQVSDGMRWFERKAHGGMGLEDGLRDVANRVRYAGRSRRLLGLGRQASRRALRHLGVIAPAAPPWRATPSWPFRSASLPAGAQPGRWAASTSMTRS